MASITSAVTDKTSYTAGQLITLTVTGTGLDETDTLSGTLSGGTPLSETITIGEVAVSDTLGKTWAQVSNNGTVAVFTATA
jgi:hypothetical protein